MSIKGRKLGNSKMQFKSEALRGQRAGLGLVIVALGNTKRRFRSWGQIKILESSISANRIPKYSLSAPEITEQNSH